MTIDCRCWLGWSLLVILLGCQSRPSAPVLRDDPVYRNDREGLRFLAPEGWRQRVNADTPPGPITKDRTIVEYRPSAGSSQGVLGVALIDLPPQADLAAHCAGASHSVKQWSATAAPQAAKVGSRMGTRYSFSGTAGKSVMNKEVVAVRHGERVYLFTALFGGKDTEARDQLRRVIASVIWKD